MRLQEPGEVYGPRVKASLNDKRGREAQRKKKEGHRVGVRDASFAKIAF